MEAIFFYGLFMDDNLLREKGFHPTSGKLCVAEGYGLRIGERATLVRSEGERSYGIVMELSEEESGRLYSGRDVSDYVPEQIEVTDSTGITCKVTSYNLPIAKLSDCNREYAESLSVAAEKMGLPRAYVDEILAWVK